MRHTFRMFLKNRQYIIYLSTTILKKIKKSKETKYIKNQAKSNLLVKKDHLNGIGIVWILKLRHDPETYDSHIQFPVNSPKNDVSNGSHLYGCVKV